MPGNCPPATAKPPTAPHPVISSCMVGGVSTVFLTNKDNYLKSYANDLPTPQIDVEVVTSGKARRLDYQSKPVDLVGSNASIKSKTRDIAALSFILQEPKDTIRSRLYYIDIDGNLAELRQDNVKTCSQSSIAGWTQGWPLQAAPLPETAWWYGRPTSGRNLRNKLHRCDTSAANTTAHVLETKIILTSPFDAMLHCFIVVIASQLLAAALLFP